MNYIKKMDELKILAKAAIDKEQISNKLYYGSKMFEIQLLENQFNISDILEVLKDVDVIAVHSPVIYCKNGDWEEIMLSDLDSIYEKKIFLKTCYLANSLALYYGHNVTIVIHCDISSYELNKFHLDYITNIIGIVMKEFPFIEIGLENISPIRNNPFRLNNGCLWGPAEVAECLKYILETDRIGTVLDICHMEMTQFLLNRYKKSDFYMKFPLYEVEDYLIKYSSSLRIIHLNEAKEDGYGSRHGLVASQNTVKRILKYLNNDGNCNPFICLEVKESDYRKSCNYIKAYKNIEKAIKELNQEYIADL